MCRQICKTNVSILHISYFNEILTARKYDQCIINDTLLHHNRHKQVIIIYTSRISQTLRCKMAKPAVHKIPDNRKPVKYEVYIQP